MGSSCSGSVVARMNLVCGGLFERLEKGVRRRPRDLVSLVDDIKLRLEKCRSEFDAFAQLSDIVDSAITRCVDLDDVGGCSRVDCDTGSTAIAWPGIGIGIEAIDRLCQKSGSRRFPVPRGPVKRYACATRSSLNRIAQRPNDRVLADQIVIRKGLRTIFPVE